MKAYHHDIHAFCSKSWTLRTGCRSLPPTTTGSVTRPRHPSSWAGHWRQTCVVWRPNYDVWRLTWQIHACCKLRPVPIHMMRWVDCNEFNFWIALFTVTSDEWHNAASHRYLHCLFNRLFMITKNDNIIAQHHWPFVGHWIYFITDVCTLHYSYT